jgi:hypothetical protein
MSFVRVWLSGLINPARSFEELKGKPAPNGFSDHSLTEMREHMLQGPPRF